MFHHLLQGNIGHSSLTCGKASTQKHINVFEGRAVIEIEFEYRAYLGFALKDFYAFVGVIGDVAKVLDCGWGDFKEFGGNECACTVVVSSVQKESKVDESMDQ